MSNKVELSLVNLDIPFAQYGVIFTDEGLKMSDAKADKVPDINIKKLYVQHTYNLGNKILTIALGKKKFWVGVSYFDKLSNKWRNEYSFSFLKYNGHDEGFSDPEDAYRLMLFTLIEYAPTQLHLFFFRDMARCYLTLQNSEMTLVTPKKFHIRIWSYVMEITARNEKGEMGKFKIDREFGRYFKSFLKR